MSARATAGFAAAIGQALRFYSRLPWPLTAGRSSEALGFAAMAPAIPVAGAVLGAVSGLAYLLAEALGLGAFIAAIAAVSCGVAVTGALHEDGLADTADAFFAPRTPAQRLDIMRDSRLGTFGVVALALTLLARITLIAVISRLGTGAVMAALIAAASLSRAAGLLPLMLLPPARADGAGAAAGRLDVPGFARAAMIGAAIAFVLAIVGGFTFWRGLIATCAPFAASYGVTVLAEAKIGGQTGDVAGAAQAMAELSIYLMLALGLGVG